MSTNQLPPVGSRGVVVDLPFERGFVLVGNKSFLARAEGGEIENGRHVRVVDHDGDELVIAALGAEEAAAVEAKLKRQVLSDPNSGGAKLYCPKCGLDQVVETGVTSQLDGKVSYKCNNCSLEMGPLRSRVLLWLLTAISFVIAVGALIFLAYDRFLGERKASYTLLLVPGLFSAFGAAGLREMSMPVPKRL